MIKNEEAIKHYYNEYILPYNPYKMPFDFLCANEVNEIMTTFGFKIFLFRWNIGKFVEEIAKAIKE